MTNAILTAVLAVSAVQTAPVAAVVPLRCRDLMHALRWPEQCRSNMQAQLNEPFNRATPEQARRLTDKECKGAPLDAAAIERKFYEQHKSKILVLLPSFDPAKASREDWDAVLLKRNGICDIKAEIEEDERNAPKS